MIDRAILLAAGEGHRLQPLTRSLPKCLVPVNGQPLLGFWLEKLADAGIQHVLINTCHHRELVETYIAQGQWQCQIELEHEPALRGTGGSLIDFRAFWQEHGTLMLHADNFGDIDLSAFLDVHERRPAAWLLTLATFDSDTPQECGIVEQLEDGTISAFHEKVINPPGKRASAAVFALSPELARQLPEAGSHPIDFSADILPGYIGRMGAWHHNGMHRDLGVGIRYLRTQWESEMPMGKPDLAWNAMLSSENGKLRERTVESLAQLATLAGFQPEVFASVALALKAEPNSDRLAIILKGNANESSASLFQSAGLCSVILEREN